MTALKSMATAGPGRPKKYGRASRPVTLTLPEDIIDRLTMVDADLGRAIVTVAERLGRLREPVPPAAELASYGRHAVIVVTPVKALKRIRGVQLVPIGGGRALISLNGPQSIPQLELDIRDAIAGNGVGRHERSALAAIADMLRQARLSTDVAISERTIIVLESKRQRR